MAWADIVTFVLIASLLVISPGPNGVLIAKTVPTSGRVAGLAGLADEPRRDAYSGVASGGGAPHQQVHHGDRIESDLSNPLPPPQGYSGRWRIKYTSGLRLSNLIGTVRVRYYRRNA